MEQKKPTASAFSETKEKIWRVSARLPYVSNPDEPQHERAGQVNKFIEYDVHIAPGSNRIHIFAQNPVNRGQQPDLGPSAPVPIIEITPQALAKAIKVGKK